MLKSSNIFIDIKGILLPILCIVICIAFTSGHARNTNNAIVNGSNVNVRIGPSTEAAIVGKIENRGTQIEIISKNDNWYYIQYDGIRKGWIYAEYVTPFQVEESAPEDIDQIIKPEQSAEAQQQPPKTPEQPVQQQLKEISTAGQAYFDLGVFAYEEGDYQNAIKNLTQAIQLVPDEPEYFHYLGKAYMETEAYDLSEKNLTDAWNMSPTLPDIQTDRAMLYYRKSDFKTAATLFQEVIKKNPSDILSTYYAANCLYHQKEYYPASRLFQKAAKANPSLRLNCLYYAGICHIKTGLYQKGYENLVQVRDDKQAGELQQYAQKWITALDNRLKKKKNMHINAQLTYQYDSNIRLEPLDEDLYSDEDDYCTQILLSGNYRMTDSRPYQISAGATYFSYIYKDFTQYNMSGSLFNLNTQLNLKPIKFGLKFSPSIIWLDSSQYMNRLAVVPTLSLKLSQKLQAILSLENKFDNNLDDDDRDAHISDNSLKLQYVLPKRKMMFFSTMRFAVKNADADTNDYDRIVSSGGMQLRKVWGLNFGLNGQYEQKKYKRIDPLYNAIREDFRSSSTLYIQRPSVYQWFGVKTEFKFTKNSSNINIYNYERFTLSFSFTANR